MHFTKMVSTSYKSAEKSGIEIIFSDYAFAKIFKNGKNKVVYSNLLLRMVSSYT